MTRQFRLLVSATLLLGSTLYSNSATVSLDEARAIASEFIGAHSGIPADKVKLEVAFTAGSKTTPLYYVFNATDNGGFVLISAENTTTPVLGYSFEGNYPVNTLPDAMQWMLTGIEREIVAAPKIQTGSSVADRKGMARSAAMHTNSQKLLATPDWSQEAPFNSLIPGKPLVGCVGTAMATVMKYHQWPVSGTGSFDGVDFGLTYDWASMRTDNYRSGYTAAEGEAVGTLMYHASKSIDTKYAMSGSSAYEVRVPAALSTYFGYDPGVSYKKRAEVATQQDWDKIVKDEIDAGRPVIYCGQDVTAGHAFVCDGYQGEYLHFNWGWGGSANGYFLSTALNPTVSRTHHYNNLNTIIYNIKPSDGTVAVWSPIHITADGNQPGIGSDLTDLASGKSFTVRVGNLKNLAYSDFKGKIAVALCAANGMVKSLLCNASGFSLPSMATLANGYVDFRNCALPSGTAIADGDRVLIVTQADGATEWLPVAGELPTVNELAVSTDVPASFRISLPSATGAAVEGEPSVIRGWNYSFKVTPENPQTDVVTVKANGYVLTVAADYTYTIANVREDQNVTVLVQNAADVREKRSVWVGTPGTLSSVIPEEESGTIKELTIFGFIDARDFAFMKSSMRLTRVDLSGARINAHGTDQANALPREAFRGMSALNEAVLPPSLNRINNGAFRQTGITTVTIPANVKTYEYNVFVGCSKLRHIWVGRETAEFINWCVLSGVKTKEVTLHVPSERAVTNYSKAENWNTIGNIIVDPIPAKTDVLFAVMDNADVKFDSETMPGSLAKGSEVAFTAAHIADNDNRMEVYANSTLLSPDAEGVYHTTVAENTIVHFALVEPIETIGNSQWTLTAANGSIGLFTDAVNVIPGEDFTIRVNALNVPKGYEQFFWAAALTDADGRIKEFISPVNIWTGGAGDGMKMNVFCCVKDSHVREGNAIRIVTSANKKMWNLVAGADDSIVDALPALNNMTPVYNINIPEVADATISGAVTTAVRGRDITLKITPKSAANRIDMSVNDTPVAKGAASVSYTFVAMSDMDFDIKVYDPKAEGSVTYTVASGELYKAVTAETVCAHVIVTGETYASDISLAFTQPFAQKTIKKLDLTGLTILADPTNGNNAANMIPSEMFYKSSGIGQTVPVVEEILLPNSVTRIGEAAFKNCANLKEIRLPESLIPDRIQVGTYASGSPKYGYPIGYGCFQGCTSLTTIYIPGELNTVDGRQVVCHFNPYSSYNSTVLDGSTRMYDLGFTGTDGKPDATKITIVVPAEYLSVYTTPYSNRDYGNPWKAQGYNILSENPVYGVNFDPARIVPVEENYDITSMASFLGDNVPLESMKVEGKLKLVDNTVDCRVYDNGTAIATTADGLIDVEFFNPAKKADAAGNHNLSVVYTYDVMFHPASDLFTLSQPEVENGSAHKFESFDTTDAKALVLKKVAENSTVRFSVSFASEHADAIEARVMEGIQELAPDADGFYTVEVANADKTIEIFAVPGNGATLNEAEIAAIDPAQSAGVTSIALEGTMSAETLAQALECFPSLETLDLSGYEGELPDGAFAGMTTLTTVSMPEVDAIGPDMFSGCTSLESVDIPASVTAIGEGAFSNCSALTNIRLTGISSIGDGAFNGCDNLTTITLLADNTEHETPETPAVSRSARSEGISAKAFEGLNPNCVVVVDQGVTTPAAGVNFIVTSTGTITETMADGTTAEREGRIYTATSPVAFYQGHPLAIPHAFSLAEGVSVTLEAENEKWCGLVVPFDVETITDGTDKPLEITIVKEDAEKAYGNLLYTLEEGAENLHSAGTIAANTPYLFHTPELTKVVFSTTTGKIPSTPAEVRVDGKEYSLHATYAAATLPATSTYLLADDATAFKAAGIDDDETIGLSPFEVYATSPAAVTDIATGLPEIDITSGIDHAVALENGLRIAKEGSAMVIYSPDSRTETIYTIDGRVAGTIALQPGRNNIEMPLNGIYIVAATKIRL